MPRNKEPEVARPSKKAEFGSGSGVLGALSSTTFAHKPLGSNMQRLGNRMNIPSAIDMSGLVQFAPAKAPDDKAPAPASGAGVLSIKWKACCTSHATLLHRSGVATPQGVHIHVALSLSVGKL